MSMNVCIKYIVEDTMQAFVVNEKEWESDRSEVKFILRQTA